MANFQKNNLAIQLATVQTFHGLFGTFWACASLSKPKQESVNFLMMYDPHCSQYACIAVIH
jgi:hypothetical protein